ncbi:MAG: sulfotransferase family 2 domain-containing protein [Cypionkella sp.]
MARQQPRMESLLSCRSLPIRYLVIPKCGCTFVKNLIWRLDHGEDYVNPPRIHERTRDFARVAQFNLTLDEVRAEAFSFVVLRNPIDRFMSLYFDKVVGEGYRKFVPLRAVLRDNHGLDVEAATPSEHLRNCHIMIDWIEENLAKPNEIGRDPHWTPQHFRMETIRAFDMKVLPLSKLDNHLTLLLSDVVPDIATILGKLERYTTNSKALKEQVLDGSLKERIWQIYARDRSNYEKLQEVWRNIAPKSSAEIPRASEVFE